MTQEAGRKRAKGESKVGAATGVFWQVNEKFVPKGLVGLRVSRPFGTCALRALDPGVETPGYSRLSPRDGELACSIATTIMGRSPKPVLKTHFYLVHPKARKRLNRALGRARLNSPFK